MIFTKKDKYLHGVVEISLAISSYLKGTSDWPWFFPIQDAVEWLNWRINIEWDDPSSAFDLLIRAMARLVIQNFHGRVKQ